ncbi:TraR/DksA C4-type zinc finger protein [Collimonas sp. NPDC087041]|uniref:TraR/DksA C4-type zinc finger protein n=1 Tax=Collimonas sp. NPDC087041 TaxID=3363960 RepID=UPI003812C013
MEEAARLSGIEQSRRACAGTGCAICITCEEPIPVARRAAVPHAQRCTGCQQHHEGVGRGR